MFKKIIDKLGWMGFGFTLAIPTAFAAAVIFSGDEVKTLKANLSLNNIVKWRTSSGDPEGAVIAPIGSIHSNTVDGSIHRKIEGAGSSGWASLGGRSGVFINILEEDNPDAEANDSHWTESGSSTLARTVTSADVAFGKGSFEWDPSAASENVTSDAVTIPEGLFGKNCLLRMFVKDSTTDHKVQVWDGSSSLAEVDLITTSNYAKVIIPFECPSSGTLAARIESAADTPAMQFDEVYIGEDFLVGSGSTSDPHRMVAEIKYDKDDQTSCIWTTTATTPSAFNANAACGVITQLYSAADVTLDTADNDLPDIDFDDLPEGQYWVKATLTGGTNSTAGDEGLCYSLSDGTSIGAETCMQAASFTSNMHLQSVTLTAQFTHAGGAANFAVYGDSNNNANIAIYNRGVTQHYGELQIEVWKMSSENPEEGLVQPDIQGWNVRATISGANITLGSGTDSTFKEITNASLTMAVDTNVTKAEGIEIPCSGTNASTSATNCSAGNEVLGLVVQIPVSGRYEICGQFENRIFNPNSEQRNIFSWVETANTCTDATCDAPSDSIQQSVERIRQGNNGVSDIDYDSVRVCGQFKFDSVGQKTMRLMFTKSGTSNANEIRTDGGGNMVIDMKRLSPHIDNPLLDKGNISTPDTNLSEKYAFVSVRIPPTCPNYTNEYGDFVDTITGANVCTVNFNAGFWKDVPNCTCTDTSGSTTRYACHTQLATTSSVQTNVVHTSAGSTGVAEVKLHCHGPIN
jgi:hypothetical protein